MTVSRVINGEASVRGSTKEAVDAAILELGYSPNKAARSLASASQIRIGLLYANPNSTFLSKMLLGVMEQSRQSDTQIVVVECKMGAHTDSVIDGMVEEGIDGIILAPPLSDSAQAFKTCRRHNLPTVTVGSPHQAEEVSSVYIDDFQAAVTITNHIIELGHTRIAFIIGTSEQAASTKRLEGYRAAMKAAGIEIRPELVIQGDFSYRSGFDVAGQLLSLKPRPTAILASNDDMAAGVIAMAQRQHIMVPDELTVCGFDDSLFATTIWPNITTIRQPIAEMSRLAIEMLEKKIRRRRRDSKKIVTGKHRQLDFIMMLRDSEAPPADLSK